MQHNRRNRRTSAVAVLALATAGLIGTLAGCGQGPTDTSPPPSKGSPGVDLTDPYDVAQAYAHALTSGSCEAFAEVKRPDVVDCTETDTVNEWVEIKYLGLDLDTFETDEGDADIAAGKARYRATFYTADGFQVAEQITLVREDGLWVYDGSDPKAEYLRP